MGKFELAVCEKEIKRCSRIYKGFRDAEPFIGAVCKSVSSFFQENPVTLLLVFDAEEAEDQIRAGNSIGLNPPLVTEDVVELLKRISKAVAKTNPKLKGTVKILNERFDNFLSDSPAEVSKEDVLNLRDSLIKETVLEKDLATFLFSILLSSFYRQQLKSIVEVLRTDLWEGGNCPLCGEKPHFGMLKPDDGAKQLECWLCGTEWLHTRIKCPFCNNEEQEELGYFTAEDSELCRVNFCQSCCHYYKIFDLRKYIEDGEVVLTIHNLASLSYDLLAGQEGFSSGSGLQWVNDNEVSDKKD